MSIVCPVHGTSVHSWVNIIWHKSAHTYAPYIHTQNHSSCDDHILLRLTTNYKTMSQHCDPNNLY